MHQDEGWYSFELFMLMLEYRNGRRCSPYIVYILRNMALLLVCRGTFAMRTNEQTQNAFLQRLPSFKHRMRLAETMHAIVGHQHYIVAVLYWFEARRLVHKACRVPQRCIAGDRCYGDDNHIRFSLSENWRTQVCNSTT